MECRIYEELKKIADKRNIELIEDMVITSNFEGLYFEFENTELISLNKKLEKNPKKRNFVLAHELGHAALHKGKIDSVLYFKDNSYRNIFEKEADDYAYNLLNEIRGGLINE